MKRGQNRQITTRPLIDYAKAVAAGRGDIKDVDDGYGLIAGKTLADVLGVTPRTYWRWNAGQTTTTLRNAEDICDRLDVHPTTVYGDDYYRAAGCLEAAS